MRSLNRNEQNGLVRKLGGRKEEGAKHTKIKTEIGDPPIVFGLSRGSNPKTGHLPKQLGISHGDVLGLAQCRLSKEWYIERVKKWRSPTKS